MPDAAFSTPRLARLYDPLDPDRSDLDVYLALAGELGARSVLDLGCGTGNFACMLAARDVAVTGVDPAGASLDVARGKPGADRVRWVRGDATGLPSVEPPLAVDLATMTGNVAQVFVTDEEWSAVLRAVRAVLRPGGRLVFESRDPAFQGWREWTPERSLVEADVPGEGRVSAWVELTEVALPLVSFRSTYRFARDGAVLTSESTLRFRGLPELTASLAAAGFAVEEVREAPDRPGRELVVVAARPD